MQHTTGKWTNRTAGDPTPDSGLQIYAGGVNIATVHYGARTDYDEAKANARLISASPMLYEACKQALAYCHSDPAIHPLNERLRGAIAAAEGGTK